MRTVSRIFFCSVSLLTSLNFCCQNFDEIGKKNLLKVNGGVNTSSVFYSASGAECRCQPFTYNVNANIRGSILGISLPFTFNYSNNQIKYSQPANFQSFTPSYKWAKAYFGVTALNFSPYTQAGHPFTGAGLELNPGKFKIALLYGIFKKAHEFDYELNSAAYMSYKRTGLGSYIGYENKGHSLKVIYFSAKDDPGSIRGNTSMLAPMKSSVVSFIGKTTLFKKLTLDAEWAMSALRKNTLAGSENFARQFRYAFKSSASCKIKSLNLAVNYERVNPDYATLGTYFINNDFQNITFSPSFYLLKGKLSLNANAGIQHNNLENQKLATSNRFVGSFSISYRISEKWLLNGSYSNFSSFTKQNVYGDPGYTTTLDTLSFYQLSQSGSFAASYNFGNNEIKQNIMFNGLYQVTEQAQGSYNNMTVLSFQKNDAPQSLSFNNTLFYNATHSASKISFGLGLNVCSVIHSNMQTMYYGPNLNISRALFRNNLRLALTGTYNQSFVNASKTSEIIRGRFALSFSPKLKNEKAGKLNLNFNVDYLTRLYVSGVTGPFNEFTCTIGAGYNF